MRSLLSAAFALAMLATLMGGCTTRTSTDQTMIFDIAGPVAVDVASFNGDVNVYVDDKLDHAEVTVTREGSHGFLREGESSDSLPAIEYSASVEAGNTGPVLTVRTSTTHPEPHFQAAHVTVRLPAVDGLTVHTNNGRVYAKDVYGPIDISTTRGDVRLMTNWPLTQPVTVKNDRGDIDFRVRGESTGAILAHADGGHVLQDCRFGKFRVHSHSDEVMNASLNDGGNPVELATTYGNIRISVVNNPTEVGIFIWEP